LAGDATGAIEAARRRVELDPLDEPGQRRVMSLLARSGDRSGAIRQYRALVALFDRELGVAPLSETTDLYEAIREDRAESPTDRVADSSPTVAVDADLAVTAFAAKPVLVGRDDDLAAILRAHRAAKPDGRVVVVEGEAGIGKTRLVEAVVDAVRSSGGTALGTRGYPGEAGIPYGPIAQLLRAGLATPGGVDRLAVLDDTARHEIGRLVDLPAELRPPRQAVGPANRSARVRLLDGIATALTSLVAGPSVGALWIDDLHLADDSTREFVAYLARRLAGRPLVLILAWRREDLSEEALATAEDLLRMPGVLDVTLERLERSAVVAMIRAARLGTDTKDAYIDAVVADAEGLPL
ncbi:MAG TPA: AAA family ATPase, partial [Candidatus Saccharimonadia bacterium]|nr:AAA family ATPase [Candidatus Saccharimonadia bacterium]